MNCWWQNIMLKWAIVVSFKYCHMEWYVCTENYDNKRKYSPYFPIFRSDWNEQRELIKAIKKYTIKSAILVSSIDRNLRRGFCHYNIKDTDPDSEVCIDEYSSFLKYLQNYPAQRYVLNMWSGKPKLLRHFWSVLGLPSQSHWTSNKWTIDLTGVEH